MHYLSRIAFSLYCYVRGNDSVDLWRQTLVHKSKSLSQLDIKIFLLLFFQTHVELSSCQIKLVWSSLQSWCHFLFLFLFLSISAVSYEDIALVAG